MKKRNLSLFTGTSLMLALIGSILLLGSCTQTDRSQEKMQTHVKQSRKAGTPLAAKLKQQKTKKMSSEEQAAVVLNPADTLQGKLSVQEESQKIKQTGTTDQEILESDSLELEKYFAEANQEQIDSSEFVLVGER
jgi:hypothetical protein